MTYCSHALHSAQNSLHFSFFNPHSSRPHTLIPLFCCKKTSLNTVLWVQIYLKWLHRLRLIGTKSVVLSFHFMNDGSANVDWRRVTFFFSDPPEMNNTGTSWSLRHCRCSSHLNPQIPIAFWPSDGTFVLWQWLNWYTRFRPQSRFRRSESEEGTSSIQFRWFAVHHLIFWFCPWSHPCCSDIYVVAMLFTLAVRFKTLLIKSQLISNAYTIPCAPFFPLNQNSHLET